MVLFAAGLLVFFAVHTVPMQADLRAGLVKRFGTGTYKGIFSVISAIGLALIVIGYHKINLAGKNPQLWFPPVWARHVALVIMLPALILLVAAYVPSRIRTAAKHPMLAAIKLWALAHLLANGDLAGMVLFVSFLIYAVADRISMKHRNTAITPNRQNGSLTGDFAAIAGGTLAYLVLVLFAHNLLFGVAPLPGFGF